MSGSAKSLLVRLWREHIVAFWPILLAATLLMVIEGGTLGLMSYLVQPLFDEVFVAGDAAALTWVAFAIAGIFSVRAFAGFGQRLLIVKVGLRVTTDLQTRLIAHLLALDARFFQDNSPGALIERVRGDTFALQGLASATLMSIGRDTIAVISLVTVMVVADWQWALMALAGVPLLIVPLYSVQKRIRSTTFDAREAASDLSTQLDEIFHGMVSIKVNRLERYENSRFGKQIAHFLGRQMRAERGKAASPALIDLSSAIGFLVVVYFGGSQIISGEKSLGEFMSFFTALALVFDPMRRLSTIAGQIQAAMASLERLYAVLETQPTILAPAQPVAVRNGDVVFDDVRFAYEESEVLRGLSFTAQQGKTTALVGPSGAGKSTVFSLLTRLVDPGSGRITIGGAATTDVDIAELRDSLALVGQDSTLFDDTIAQNIRLGRLDASDDEVRAAAEAASVLEFANQMPLGLDTPVGPRGSGLSGGQRQRVTIARAMLRNAPILLLDEPTSALDARSEKLVGEALDRLSQGRTTLVIAHRLSTIRDADLIVVMDKGHVVEQGSHAELMAADGAYARLHQLQSAGVTAPL